MYFKTLSSTYGWRAHDAMLQEQQPQENFKQPHPHLQLYLHPFGRNLYNTQSLASPSHGQGLVAYSPPNLANQK